MKLRNLLYALGLLLALSGYTQRYDKNSTLKDYVILYDSVMIPGEVRLSNESSTVDFKARNKQYFETYGSDSVTSFRSVAKFYSTKRVNNQLYFAEALVLGDVSLYAIADFFLLEENSSSRIVEESNLSKVFSEVYDDKCNWSYNRSNLKYHKELLTSIVRGYNKATCFKVQTNPFGFVLTAGSYSTKLKPNASIVLPNGIDFQKVLISFGVFKEFPLHKRTSFIATLEYYRVSSLEYSVQPIDLDFRESFFVIGVTPRFYIKDFFIDLGVISRVLHSSNQTLTLNDEQADLNTKGVSLGYNAGLGYRIHKNPNQKVIDIILHSKGLGNKNIGYTHTGISLRVGF
ncbi:hypothetical protein [Ekhidna sp. To15]|uniref:hypothetical protein n=1 Tax=Ekhidna sp. To15 TaxID=3395267 RepID=UPI003F526E5A